MYFTHTLLKFGGGFLPLHKFERAHTAFLVVVSLFEFVNNLPKKKKKTKTEKKKKKENCHFTFISSL